MELRHYLAVLRRRLILLIGLMLLAGSVAYVATPKTPEYSARSVIYVGATQFNVSPSANAGDPSLLVARLMKTYAVMLGSEQIAGEAVQRYAVPRTAKKAVKETTVTPGTDTQLLTVNVVDRDPGVAATLANGLADSFMAKVSQAQPKPGPGALPSLSAYIFERAQVPDSPQSSGLARNIALAAFFGLLVGGGVALLLDQLDSTLRSSVAAEARLQLPVLATLPFNSTLASGVQELVVPVRRSISRARPQPHPHPGIGA